MLLLSAGVWTRLRNLRLVFGIALVLLIFNVAIFVVPLTTDPVLAGALILWHAALIGRLFFPSPPLVARPKAGDALGVWLATHGPAVRHLLMVSLIATTAVVGYKLSDEPFALLLCLFLDALAISLSAPLLYHLWQAGSRFRAPALAAGSSWWRCCSRPRPRSPCRCSGSTSWRCWCSSSCACRASSRPARSSSAVPRS